MDRRIKLPEDPPGSHSVDLAALAKLGGGTVDQLRAVNPWMLQGTPCPGHETVVPPGWAVLPGEFPGGGS